MQMSEGTTTNLDNMVIKQEVNLQYHWYLLCFFIIYLTSFLIPGAIFMIYIWCYFLPNFLEIGNILFIFRNLNPLLSLLLMPGIILLCYVIHLFFIAFTTRWMWAITEKRSPSKDGIVPRNIPSKTINYYHIRSFMIKYAKYVFSKGLFPWLLNWLYNYVGTNKIGKGTTIEEEVGADKYVEIGEGTYIGVNSIITSHVVEGIFGNISYFKVKLGDNITCGGINGFGPGSVCKDDAYLLPFATAGKYHNLKGDNYYFGIPIRKIFPKKVMDYLKLSPRDLEKNKRKKE